MRHIRLRSHVSHVEYNESYLVCYLVYVSLFIHCYVITVRVTILVLVLYRDFARVAPDPHQIS
jgi:hypothetical protein